jgi:hypothetical protein
VGSTCSTLSRRKSGHKKDSKNNEKSRSRVYQHLNDVGWDNVDIVLIEKYPCDDLMELERRERFWIETLSSSLNKNIPTRSHKEYYVDNKETILERNKQYRLRTKKHIKQQKRQYYNDNKEYIMHWGKQYRVQNRAQIKKYKSMRLYCVCGSTYTPPHRLRHMRTNKHNALILQNELPINL